MKKLIFIFAFLGSVLVHAQSITDKGEYVKITYTNGKIVGVVKSHVATVEAENDIEVTINTSLKRLARLDYDDFGYDSVAPLQDYLLDICSNRYFVVNNSSTDPDSCFYMDPDDITDTLLYSLFIKNANDSIVGTGPKIPWE